jgi:hypothetical protein
MWYTHMTCFRTRIKPPKTIIESLVPGDEVAHNLRTTALADVSCPVWRTCPFYMSYSIWPIDACVHRERPGAVLPPLSEQDVRLAESHLVLVVLLGVVGCSRVERSGGRCFEHKQASEQNGKTYPW